MAIVYLGLGSNLGNRQKNIQIAVDKLKKFAVRIHQMSTIIETEPAGGPPQGKFLNAVVKTETELSPLDLLNLTQSIEKQLGREQTVKNGPRPIDIDILLYDQKKISTPQLIIPHPRMHKRNFVMIPLNEIASEIAERMIHDHR